MSDTSMHPIIAEMERILATPAQWTRRTYARTFSGAPCYPEESTAVCWCVDGAFQLAVRRLGREIMVADQRARHVHDVMMAVAEARGYVHYQDFNDVRGRTFEDMRAFLRDVNAEVMA